jgi:hypothetical protein
VSSAIVENTAGRSRVTTDFYIAALPVEVNVDPSQYGDGRVRGILSVDVSDWEAPSEVFGKPARECTAEEIKEEVWTQLKHHLNDSGATPIDDANLVAWFLDPDIEFHNPGTATNAEPLLINTASGSTDQPAELWPLDEPGFLKPFQEIDRIRFRLRLPHSLPPLKRSHCSRPFGAIPC